MESLTQQLNEIRIPFTFKVLYNPSDYGRYDSGVLYFEKSNYEAVQQVLTSVYAENQLHFRTEVPLFTKLLAPGLALAEEPDCKFAAVWFPTELSESVREEILESLFQAWLRERVNSAPHI